MLKVVLQYALPTVANVLNRLFFSGTGSTTGAALNTWSTNVAAAWTTNMAPKIKSACTLVAVTVEDLTSSTSPVGAWSGGDPGSFATGNNLAPGVCMIVKNLIPNRSRGGHSRTYLTGMNDSYLSVADSNIWGAASATTILTAWNAFMTAITGVNGPTGYSGLTQCVPNYYKGFTSVQNPLTKRWRNVPTVNPTPGAPPLVTARAINLVVGSQRRRNHQSV